MLDERGEYLRSGFDECGHFGNRIFAWLSWNVARVEDEGSRDRAAGRLRQLRGLAFLELPGTKIAVEMNLSALLDSS